MDESNASETIPDLKDIEMKIGRKTPEGLLRWMREEAPSLRGDAKLSAGDTTSSSKETGRKSLDDKIRKLKMEMAHLRSVDVKILHQLLAVHEGIEAVKWLLEERSTLTSRCSSLTSSQYSLGEGPDCSWRGSWSSLQDPNDKLDNISIGSYLDTLADDMDEYCPSSSESVICNTTPHVSEAASGLRTGAGVGGRSRSEVVGMVGASENGSSGSAVVVVGNGMDGKVGQGIAGLTGAINAKTAISLSSPQVMSEQNNTPVWTKVAMEKGKGNSQIQAVTKANGVIEKATMQTGSLNDKLGTSHGSPKLRPYKNGKIDLDGTCKMNGKMHMEYDAHWRWVQSQEDVTFL